MLRSDSISRSLQVIAVVVVAAVVLALWGYLIVRDPSVGSTADGRTARDWMETHAPEPTDAPSPSAPSTDDVKTVTAAPGDLRATIGGQRARLTFEPTATDSPMPLAIYAHGQSGNVNDHVVGPWLQRLRADGWAVATSDLHLENWGSSEAVSDLAALRAWAGDQVDVDKVMLIGASMGALSTLDALESGAVSADCWYGTMPAVNLTWLANQSMFAPAIAANLTEPVADRDPLLGEGFPPIRYRVLASPDDTQVRKVKNADELVADLQDTPGAEVSAKAVSGEHGDPSHFDPTDLAAFAATCR